MLIIEGPDCVGKTTAARYIAQKTGWAYKHMSKPGPDFDHFLDYMCLAGENAVWDRFHLGSLAYGIAITNEGQDQEFERLRAVTRLLDFFGVTTVIMYSSDRDWMLSTAEHDERDQMYDTGKIVAVNDVYRWMARDQYIKDGFRGMKFCHISHDVMDNYPTELQLDYWIEVAKSRARGVK